LQFQINLWPYDNLSIQRRLEFTYTSMHYFHIRKQNKRRSFQQGIQLLWKPRLWYLRQIQMVWTRVRFPILFESWAESDSRFHFQWRVQIPLMLELGKYEHSWTVCWCILRHHRICQEGSHLPVFDALELGNGSRAILVLLLKITLMSSYAAGSWVALCFLICQIIFDMDRMCQICFPIKRMNTNSNPIRNIEIAYFFANRQHN